MRMADDDIVTLAGVDDFRHRIEHDRVLCLARIAELLREIAFANQNGADAGHILENVVEVLDAGRIFNLQNDEQLALGRQRPDVSHFIIFSLADAPIAASLHRAIATNALRLIQRLVLQARIAAGGNRIIGFFDRRDMREDNAVATNVERLFGQELILLNAVRRHTRHRRDFRRNAALRNVAAVQHILQSVAHRCDVPTLMLTFEHNAIVIRLCQFHRDIDVDGLERRESMLATFQRADNAVEAGQGHIGLR